MEYVTPAITYDVVKGVWRVLLNGDDLGEEFKSSGEACERIAQLKINRYLKFT